MLRLRAIFTRQNYSTAFPECIAKVKLQNGTEIRIIFCRLKCPIIPFRIELGSSKLASKEFTLSFISLIIFIKKYAVVLPYEVTENLKW